MMRRTPMPARVIPLHREPLAEVITITGGARVVPLRKPIRAASKRRARVNRQRAAMADRLWPDRREGTVLCAGRPGCTARAEDLHEPRFRSRLGSITDPDNGRPVCRACHLWIHTHEVEAARLGLAVNSWADDGGDAA